MTRSVETLYIQRSNLNLEVQIFIRPFRVVYIHLCKPYFFVKEKAEGKFDKYGRKTEEGNKLYKILVVFYGLTILLPVTMLWVLILGYPEVNEMYEEAERIAKGGKAGYCGQIVFFQRSEDVEQDD